MKLIDQRDKNKISKCFYHITDFKFPVFDSDELYKNEIIIIVTIPKFNSFSPFDVDPNWRNNPWWINIVSKTENDKECI